MTTQHRTVLTTARPAAMLALLLALGLPASAADGPPMDLQVEWQFAVGFGATEARRAYQGDLVYLQITLTDRDGNPLVGERLRASSAVGNRLLEDEPVTGDDGITEIMLVAERLGDDVIAVSGAGVSQSLTFTVDEPPVQDFAAYAESYALPEMDGVTSWSMLENNVDVEYDDYMMIARFGRDIRALDGQEVRIAGYMTPLENSERQRHFVLSAQPPHCFFHFLGGPASVAEVLSDEGVRFSYDPMVLTGRLELIESSDLGIVYRLTGARAVDGN